MSSGGAPSIIVFIRLLIALPLSLATNERYRRFRWPLGALAVLTVVTPALAGGAGGLIVLVGGFLSIVALTDAFTRRSDDRAFVGTVMVIGFMIHVAFASVLHLILVQRGFGGALFDDDTGYAMLASLIAQTWHGERVVIPYDPSTVNSYVYMASGVFWLLGPNVLALKLVNVTLGVATGLFVHRTALLFFGRRSARAALVGLLVFPSLTLWSSLALKDAFTYLLSIIVVWSLTEFLRTQRYALLVLATFAVLPIESARQYLYIVLLVAAPPALWLVLVEKERRNIPAAALGTLAAALLLTHTVNVFTIDRVVNLDTTRRNMAEGARTAFIEPTRIVVGQEGSRFVVTVPQATTDPGRTPEVIVAAPGTNIIFSGRPTDAASPPPNSVVVKPGDIIVVSSARPASAPPATTAPAATQQPQPTASPAPATTAPAATQQPQPTASPAPEPTTQTMIVLQTGSAFIAPPEQAEADSLQRIWQGVSHLPKGAAYLIGAPFPWDVRSTSTLALMIDLVLWYPTVLCAVVGIMVLARRRFKDASYALLVMMAIAAILSLIEGNVGTLARHRGLVIPLALVFASGGVEPVVRWITGRSQSAAALVARLETIAAG